MKTTTTTNGTSFSVWCYNPYWEDDDDAMMWQPADIAFHGDEVTCQSCGKITRNWMVTYLQGGPPAAIDDPDNVWFYECLDCALESSEGNIVSVKSIEENGWDVTS